MTSPDGETIQGGHFRIEKGFDRGLECLVLTAAISQTWDLMISWSDN